MKHHCIRRYLIALLCTLLALGCMAAPALADTIASVQYIKRSWTGTAVKSETKTKTNVPGFPESTSVPAGTYVKGGIGILPASPVSHLGHTGAKFLAGRSEPGVQAYHSGEFVEGEGLYVYH